MDIFKLIIKPLLLRNPQMIYIKRNKPEPCKKYIKVSHCIFDLDGVILDNHELLDNAYKAVFEAYRQQYTKEWRDNIMGMTNKGMWQKVIKELKIKATWEEMNENFNMLTKESLQNAPLRPGVERLLEHLAKHRVPMALVTSSKKATMEIQTQHIGSIMAFFEHVLCAGDDPHVQTSKPHEEVYAIATIRFKDKPDSETCLVFEDTPIGVTAAKNACMQVIGVPCCPTTSRDLRHADEVVNTLRHFWPGKYGLVPFPEQKNRRPPSN